MNTIDSKETIWEGVTFRSRLECQWSIFLTHIGWRWVYEPQLGINGWLPDFGLDFNQAVFVEVKPRNTIAGLREDAVKARRRHFPNEVLLLGVEPNLTQTGGLREQTYLGALWSPAAEGRRLQHEAVPFQCGECKRPSFYGSQSAYCRVCGTTDLSKATADTRYHHYAWRAAENTMERVRRANRWPR